MNDFDFVDYILRYDKLYSSDVVFYKDSFKSNDGTIRPIAQAGKIHIPEDYIGEAILENRDDGIVAKCRFNKSDLGQAVKDIFNTTDEYGISVYANGIEYDNLGYPVNIKKVKRANVMAVIVVPKAGLIKVIDDFKKE